MQSNLFIKRQKDFLFAESWFDSFLQWLHSLPLPFSLTCTLIGTIYFFSFLKEFQVDFDNLILFSFIFSFSLAYSLYLAWHIESIQKSLSDSLSIFKKDNIVINTAKIKSKWLIIAFSLVRSVTVFSVLLFLVVGWAYSGNLIQAISMSWFFIMLCLVFLITKKIYRIIFIIYKLKSQVFEINLWDLSPLYQLSQLTQKIALYLLPLPTILAPLSFVLTKYFYQNGGVTLPGWNIYTAILIAQLIYASIMPFLIFIDILIFIFPIFWIRERILEAKKSSLAELGKKLQTTYKDQDQYAEQGNFAKVKELKEYAENLSLRSELIKKVSDWPWETRIFREFSGAIFIPLALWISQFLIARWLEK